MTCTRSVLALFDYDNTLVKGDSLWPFLVAAVGRWRAVRGALAAALSIPCAWSAGKDWRTAFKEGMLRRLLGGAQVADLQNAIESMRQWPVEKPAAQALREHRAKGHRVVIASGGLDLYLPSALAALPYDDLLCTRMEVVDGALTGRLIEGNCVRAKKAQTVAAYLAQRGPFDETWGYGNAPHDLPMLALCDHRVVVD